MRDAIVNLVEALIDVLDVIDGDADFEPHCDDEAESDENIAPVTLNSDWAA